MAVAFGACPAIAQAADSYAAEEIAFVELLNEYRAEHGVDPVLVSDLLSLAAARHSHDMGKYAFFSHGTAASDWFPVGATAGQRMVACGYPANAAWGENIGAGFETAREIFAAWKASDPHNKNMLDSHWKVIGVGCELVSGSPYGAYWTTDFGSCVDATAHENGGTAPPDTSPPTVTITAPLPGADVTGSVTVQVTARDDMGVARVDLFVAGSLIASDSYSPYAIVWDTNSYNPGTYTMEVRAVDEAGNSGSASQLVHVSNTSPTGTTTTISSTTTTTLTTGTTGGSTSTTTPTTTTSSPSTTTTTVAPPVFGDVPQSSVYYEAITTLTAAGVVGGYSDGMFYPGNPVTRAQFAKIIVLALDEHTSELDNLADPTFTDVIYTGSAYPFDYVEEAVALNIIKGYSTGKFEPQASVTRVQLAVMLVRAGGTALETPPAGYVLPFTDVPASAKSAVEKAHYNGLLSGKTATRFDPYSPATRGQVAKMVYGLTEALSP